MHISAYTTKRDPHGHHYSWDSFTSLESTRYYENEIYTKRKLSSSVCVCGAFGHFNINIPTGLISDSSILHHSTSYRAQSRNHDENITQNVTKLSVKLTVTINFSFIIFFILSQQLCTLN